MGRPQAQWDRPAGGRRLCPGPAERQFLFWATRFSTYSSARSPGPFGETYSLVRGAYSTRSRDGHRCGTSRHGKVRCNGAPREARGPRMTLRRVRALAAVFAIVAMVLVTQPAVGRALDRTPNPSASPSPETETPSEVIAAGLADGAVLNGGFLVYPNGMQVSVEPLDYNDCPSSWVCFWRHTNFQGRMLQYQDCCAIQNFPADFNNEMSSWRNRRGNDAFWYFNQNGGGGGRCMESRSSDSYFQGQTVNDAASSLRISMRDDFC